MRKLLRIPIAAWMAAVSCTPSSPEGRPPSEVDGAFTLSVGDASPIRRPKETPVLSAPEVFAVYVPSHVDRENDLLIGEHWVYFKLSESEWFTEKRLDGLAAATETASDAQMTPVRALGFDRALTPWKESKP